MKKNTWRMKPDDNLIRIKMHNTNKYVTMFKTSWEDLKPALAVEKIYYNKQQGYPIVYLKNETVASLHRMILADSVADNLKLEIDHIDGNKLNARLSNLRACTHSQNLQNKKPKKGKKYKGITKTLSGKWMAMIAINGKNKYLGSYVTQREAAKAYNEYVGEYGWKNKVK